MAGDSFAVSVFGIRLELPESVTVSLRERFSRRTLSGGPCLLVDRRWGLALDATRHPQHRTRPVVLWTAHGAPWQQWRLVRTDRGSQIA